MYNLVKKGYFYLMKIHQYSDTAMNIPFFQMTDIIVIPKQLVLLIFLHENALKMYCITCIKITLCGHLKS